MNTFTDNFYQLFFTLAATMVPIIWLSLGLWLCVKIWGGITKTAKKAFRF